MTIAIELEIAQQRLAAAERFLDCIAAISYDGPDDLPTEIKRKLLDIYIYALNAQINAQTALDSI